MQISRNNSLGTHIGGQWVTDRDRLYSKYCDCTIFCHLLYIRSGKTGNSFSLLVCSLWWLQIFGYIWLAGRTRLFVQYTISLSSLCQLIWRHWTYKMPVRYILSGVWVRLSIFSPLSIIQYLGLCAFSLPIPLVMIERIYILWLIYYHHQIGSMNFYPLFRVKSWNNGVRCMFFYIFMNNVRIEIAIRLISGTFKCHTGIIGGPLLTSGVWNGQDRISTT